MYTLYYSPGACSLAVHAILHHVGAPFEVVNASLNEGKNRDPEYLKLNPRGQVPVMLNEGRVMRESAAMMIYLADKYNSPLLPREGWLRQEVLEWLLFANSTLHQAYGSYFMLTRTLKEETCNTEARRIICKRIGKLWEEVDERLRDRPFLTGDAPMICDVLMAVLLNWTALLNPSISYGDRVRGMCLRIAAEPYFAKALTSEGVTYNP